MRVRLDAENPIALVIIAVIISLAAVGIVYWLLDALVDKILLPVMRVPEDNRKGHPLAKLPIIVALLVLVAALLLVILPCANIALLPFTLLDLL